MDFAVNQLKRMHLENKDVSKRRRKSENSLSGLIRDLMDEQVFIFYGLCRFQKGKSIAKSPLNCYNKGF